MNFYSLISLETFYNTTFKKLNGGDLNVDWINWLMEKQNFFDNQTFEFDYNNKINSYF